MSNDKAKETKVKDGPEKKYEKPKTDEKKDAAANKNESKDIDKVEIQPAKRRSWLARTFSRDPDSKYAKVQWGKVITGVRVLKRKLPDPFLERFTVTGRSYCAESLPDEYTFSDLFTKKFWKTVVVDPSSTFYYYWSMVMMMAVFYNLMFIVMRSVFEDEMQLPEYMPLWFSIDYLCDLCFLVDMFISSRVGFLEQGLVVKDIKKLRKRYLKSWRFILDVLAIIPIDIPYFMIVGFCAYVRLNRVIKIWRFVDFFRMSETRSSCPNCIRVANLVLYITIIIHWNACFYFFLSTYIGVGTDGWVYPDPSIGDWGQLSKKYLFSFYWSTLTLTTIGDTMYPETSLELLYCIICALVGVLIFATIFGNIGAMINHMDAERTEFQQKVDNVKRYMTLRGIGDELQHRVIKWFEYTWKNKQSVDDKESLRHLPEKLRAEISIHVHMMTLRRVAIFKDCEPGLLVELVLKLKLQVFSPGDFICKKGDIGKEMYIIKRGKLQVVSEDGTKVFVTLTDGAVFGEISVLNIAGNKTGNRRTASVKTVGYSDLFCLTKNDLWDALREYPEAKKMLIDVGKQILRRDNLLDEEAARREERAQQAMTKQVDMIVDNVEAIQTSIKKMTEKLDNLERGRGGGSSHSLHKTGSSVGQIAAIPEEDESQEEEDGKKNLERGRGGGSSHSLHKTGSSVGQIAAIPEEDESQEKEDGKKNLERGRGGGSSHSLHKTGSSVGQIAAVPEEDESQEKEDGDEK